MKRVWLVQWHDKPIAEYTAALKAAGYDADTRRFRTEITTRQLIDSPPDAILIDLSKAPSHGKAIALLIRQTKSTRHIPLVFAGGASEKVQALRTVLPDAVYTEWSTIRMALKAAIAHPPADPVKGPGPMGDYSGTPLPRKLGIKPNMQVGLIDAPSGLEKVLDPLPEGAELHEGPSRGAALHLWFVTDIDTFARELRRMAALARSAPLWICYPKKSAGGTLTQTDIRTAILDIGLVDYKVCAVDQTWTGLLVRQRKL